MKNRNTAGPSRQQEEQFQQALALHQSGRLAEAAVLYQKLLKVLPGNAMLLTGVGTIALQQGRLDEGIGMLDRSLQINPRQAAAQNNLGNAYAALKRWPEALGSYEKAIGLESQYAEAYSNRGNALKELGRLEEALSSLDRAVLLHPGYAEAYSNRGQVQKELKRLEAALADFDKALALNPGYAVAHYNRGVVQTEQGKPEEALASYDRAIALRPDFAEANYNRGILLKEQNRLDEALASFDRAIALNPGNAEAYSNRGVVLKKLNRLEEALASYDKAIGLDPLLAGAYCNRGDVLKALNRTDEALASYDRAIAVKPDHAEAHFNRGILCVESQLTEQALASFDHALALKPDQDFVRGYRLFTRLQICDWRDYEEETSAVAESIRRGEKAAMPHHALSMTDDPALQRQAAAIWAGQVEIEESVLPARVGHGGHERIRIGYFSADFRNHAVAVLSAGLFESHDRERFEITAFSLGPVVQDAMRDRLQKAFDRFIDVRALSDREVATLARELEIDIAVDLGGYTQHARTGIFALRAAPIQVGYLGYAGTLGSDCLDYLLADKTVVPEASQGFYSEKLAYLPNSYLVNDNSRRISDNMFSRAECGLPATGFIYSCFNNTYKFNPECFDSWMRILSATPDSVLWLPIDNPASGDALRREAVKRGIAGERLVFAGRLPSAEDYLSRLRLGDLFLDTLPYNAHTTASDALWAGLPVLTCLGESFAGRVAGSLLKAVGLPELVTSSRSAYEALAIELAAEPEKLAGIRARLAENRQSAPLFDTGLFTRHMESAYQVMYSRHQAGQPVDHLSV